MHRSALVSLLASLTACAVEPIDDPASAPGGGKADGTELSAAYTTWLHGIDESIVKAYKKQHTRAELDYLTSSSRSQYVSATAPTDAIKAAVRAADAARPQEPAGLAETTAFIARYRAVTEQTLEVILLSGTTFLESQWTINMGEAQMLDLMATLAPKPLRDGGAAGWYDAFAGMQREGVVAEATDDYDATNPRVGCIDSLTYMEPRPCGRDRLLTRFGSLVPAGNGDIDSEHWMLAVADWVTDVAASPAGSTALANNATELARVVALKPAALTGTPAYVAWLRAVGDAAESPELLTQVLGFKPCTADGSAAHASFVADHAALASATAPAACAP